MSNLRLSPSGPPIGGIALMPLRVVEDRALVAANLALTDTLQAVDAALIATLTGPFDPAHYLSVEGQVDVGNYSATDLGRVVVAIQVSVDGGAWTTVHSEDHNIGANAGSGGDPADPASQIRHVVVRSTPLPLDSWGSPPADAAEIRVRLAALDDGDTGTLEVWADETWIRLTEHSQLSPELELRQPPSGPPVGDVGNTPIRLDETNANAQQPTTLTGSPQAIDPDNLIATLTGLDPTHFFSAECELDISNDSTNVLAVVTLGIQVSFDGGAFTTVHSLVHRIGANAASAERQIRPCSVHIPPMVLADWSPPADAEEMTVRVVATMTSGEATNVETEASNAYIKLTEHAA